MNVLKLKVDELEQYNLGHSVEIKGIPKTQNGNCFDIVQNIAKKIDTNIHVNSAYRIYSSENNLGILVAKLKSIDMKNCFLRKMKKMKMNAKMIVN